MQSENPQFDLDDPLEQTPSRPSDEEYAKKEAELLAYFKEQERRKKVFIGKDGTEYTYPLTKEQFRSIDPGDRWRLRQATRDWIFATSVSAPTEAQMLAAALGTAPCPACQDTRYFKGVSVGKVTGYREIGTHICWCAKYRVVQEQFDKLVGTRYRPYDFRTIQPSPECGLPLAGQKRQWAEVRALLEADKDAKTASPKDFKPHNFLLAGKAGVGKTTTASMIAREAIWLDYINPKIGIGAVSNPARWVWLVDCQELFEQHTAWATSRFSNNPAPEPVVTVAKVERAAAMGCTPCLVIEEIDKGKLTESRFSFLFTLINAFDKNNGQLVVTTNRTLDRFIAMFSESEFETVRISGEPMIRRFFQNKCITKQWF